MRRFVEKHRSRIKCLDSHSELGRHDRDELPVCKRNRVASGAERLRVELEKAERPLKKKG